MTRERHRDEPGEHRRRDARTWLPWTAFAFVVVALIALAVAPALLLRRISRLSERVSTYVLPAYAGLSDLAFAMERQASAARGRFLTGDPAYSDRLARARAAEVEALRTLEGLASGLSPAAGELVASLRLFAVRRDSLEAALAEEGGGVEAYRAALPRFDALRDSMLVRVDGLGRAVSEARAAQLAEEARWAAVQRTRAIVLGAVAVCAALLVGWFARRQGRLRREVQRALTQAERRREELERVTESRARLMRGFTHDVKNPLGAANGYLQLLTDGIMGPLSAEQTRSLRRASGSIEAALGLVEDLLELARAESGNLEVSLAPTDICALVRDVAEEYRAQAEGKGLALALEVPDHLAPLVTTDGRRVRQVLGNLISNAVKYTREGEVTVRIERTGVGQGREVVAVAVADTGPGIPPGQRHLLFEEFARLDPAAEKGAGVGLAISRRIMEALGGEITVESEVGRGSMFTLRLPVDGGKEDT